MEINAVIQLQSVNKQIMLEMHLFVIYNGVDKLFLSLFAQA